MFEFREIVSMCEQGMSDRSCEDAIGIGKNFLFVIDGATGLNNKHIMTEYKTDAQWLAFCTRDYLLKHICDFSKSIAEIIRDCLLELRDIWENQGGGSYEFDVPSEALAVIRINNENLEYFDIGDSEMAIKFNNGSIVEILEDRLKDFDNLALDKIMKIRKDSGWKQSVRDVIRELVNRGDYHRALMNKPNGYWIASLYDVDKSVSNARTGSYSIETVHSILLCSDGYSQAIDFGIVDSLSELCNLTNLWGMNNISQKLYMLQDKDRDIREVRRFKFRDDTSAVFALINDFKEKRQEQL